MFSFQTQTRFCVLLSKAVVNIRPGHVGEQLAANFTKLELNLRHAQVSLTVTGCTHKEGGGVENRRERGREKKGRKEGGREGVGREEGRREGERKNGKREGGGKEGERERGRTEGMKEGWREGGGGCCDVNHLNITLPTGGVGGGVWGEGGTAKTPELYGSQEAERDGEGVKKKITCREGI